MAYVAKYNILISCSEFHRQRQSEATFCSQYLIKVHFQDEMDSSAFGMSIHRITTDYPFVNCLKQTNVKKAWHERIPFLSDKKAIVICAEVSPEQKSLLAVSSAGDLLWFALPSLRLIQFNSASMFDDKALPIQVAWISEEVSITLLIKIHVCFRALLCFIRMVKSHVLVQTIISMALPWSINSICWKIANESVRLTIRLRMH
jgi:hypothetical protein